jgi:hypothetical protein
VLRRHRSTERTANQPPVNTELRGNSRYRPNTKFMLPTKLLEQIHFGSPVHARPPDLLGVLVPDVQKVTLRKSRLFKGLSHGPCHKPLK